MTRYKITIEYDGSNTLGWQKQANSGSIQQFIEEAIQQFSGEIVVAYAAGRTDAGVHALAQVAHFDLIKPQLPQTVLGAINHFLRPNKICLTSCEIVSEDFHARFTAKKRHYRYEILNRPAYSTLDAYRCWHIRDKLDINKMQEAANLLIGMHDFSSFRAMRCQAKSPVKTLDEINIYPEGDKVIITFKAQSFLHHMVRNIVGTLVHVGLNKLSIEDVSNVLAAKDRKAAGPTAPAHGLYFSRVIYD